MFVRMQMLAPGDSRLCDKKDIILEKFHQLLRKLGGEELSLNISLGKMGTVNVLIQICTSISYVSIYICVYICIYVRVYTYIHSSK